MAAQGLKINNFLDRYIQGEPNYYYFNIELINGKTISGGHFHYKQHARDNLLMKIQQMLDKPEEFFHPNATMKRKKKNV